MSSFEVVIDNARMQVHCNLEASSGPFEYPVALIDTSPFSSLGKVSVFSDPDFPETNGEVWSFSSIHSGFNFNFDWITSESIYNLPDGVPIAGWKIVLTVSAMVGSGPYKLYYNFAFDKPGVTQTPYDGIPSYTAYGPEDDSEGSYIEIAGLGDYSLDIGLPYFPGPEAFANTPMRVLDRMRNNITDGYGRVSGDSGFTGTYHHGYGTFETADSNPDGGTITISKLKVIFFTESV